MLYAICRYSSRSPKLSTGPIVELIEDAPGVGARMGDLGADYRAFVVTQAGIPSAKVGKPLYFGDGTVEELSLEDQRLIENAQVAACVTRNEARGAEWATKVKFSPYHLSTGHTSTYHELRAIVDGSTVGSVFFTINQGDESVSLSKLEIDPNHQRKGLGTFLVQELQARFNDREIALPAVRPDEPLEKMFRGIPRIAVEHPLTAHLRAEIDELRSNDPDGRLGLVEEMHRIYTHSKASGKILTRDEAARFRLDRDSIVTSFQKNIDRDGMRPGGSAPTTVEGEQARLTYAELETSLRLKEEQQIVITKAMDARLIEAHKQNFKELAPRRKYTYSALKAVPGNRADEIFDTMKQELEAEHKAAGVDEKSLEEIRNSLVDCAIAAPLKAGNQIAVLKSVTTGDYATQGFGAETYARNSAEMCRLNAEFNGLKAEILTIDRVHHFPTGRHDSREFRVVAMVESRRDAAIFRKKPGAPIRDVLKMLMQKGTNPRVYFPFLEHGFEAKLGLDHFGNDVPTADVLAARLEAKTKRMAAPTPDVPDAGSISI